MMNHRIVFFFLPFLALAHAEEISPEQLEFFEKEIRPIFVDHCYKCHATDSEKIKGGFVIDSKWGWETGGDSGPAVVPGNLDESLIIDAVRRTEDIIDPMPPKTKLSDAQVAALEKWVEMGAPDPRPKVEKDGALVEEFDLQKRYEEHWSWRPVANPEPPSVKNVSWPKSVIDQFVLAKIEEAGLQPANPADKRTWLRRVYFDLIGLPPTRDQIAAFLADNSPSAHEKVVQQLLDSAHFGEKWARHWMDLVRYAETCGHEFDYPIPGAHQYRDYLIRALNADIPYDQFIREHIAGDLVEPRRNPDEQFNESVLATGFWYFHDATHAPTDVLQDEADHLDSQIDVMGKAFQGLTIACARCHDHKFDAISTADYYALTGYIQGSARTDRPIDRGRQIEMATAHQNELRVDAAKLLRQATGDTAKLGTYLTAAVELLKAEAGKPVTTDPWAGIVFDDFEGGYDRWKVEGKAFGQKPDKGHPKQRLGGVRGKTFANSFPGNDGAQGKLTSDLFTIEKPFINFLIAGGTHKQTRIELLVDGKPVRTASGNNSDVLKPKSWSVADLKGKAAELRIVDEHRGGWGHVDVDHIVFSDAAAGDATTAKIPAAADIAAKAKAANLDEARLTAWCAVLGGEGKDDKNVDHFFPVWLKNPNIVSGLRDAVKRDQDAQTAFEENAELFADFSGDKLPEGWTATGFGFQTGGETASLAFGDEQQLLAAPGVVDSGLFGANQVGTLRSPSFPIPDARILVRARSNDVLMRVVPSNYHMAIYNGLLFRGTYRQGKETATEGDWRWISFDGNLNKYIGQNGYVEFVDSKGGSVAIDAVYFLKDGGPPNRRHPLVERVVSSDDPAAGLDKIWSEIVANLKSGKGTAEDAEVVNWLAKKKLINAADLHPQLAAIHEDGLKAAAAMAIPEMAPTMTQGTQEDAFVYIRGAHANRGEDVPNRYLEALGAVEGNRLDLANEIANAENPLTSRVVVNRLWHHLFGRGLVPTVDDFGPQGQLPSHPQLLDWLATDFVENGWSMKHTIREIVLSQTYLQDSVAHQNVDPAKIATADPENILLHHMPVRRLQGEAIRDAILTISGRLDTKQFGPSIATHRTAFMTGRGARGSGPLDGAGRRSVYGAVYRNFLSPFMATFDVPGPFGPKGRRSVSNVPAQALALMNDPFVIEMSKLWARNTQATPEQTPGQRLAIMIEAATGREPDTQQLQIFQAFLEQQAAEYGAADERAWADVGHALFNTKDFVYLN